MKESISSQNNPESAYNKELEELVKKLEGGTLREFQLLIEESMKGAKEELQKALEKYKEDLELIEEKRKSGEETPQVIKVIEKMASDNLDYKFKDIKKSLENRLFTRFFNKPLS